MFLTLLLLSIVTARAPSKISESKNFISEFWTIDVKSFIVDTSDDLSTAKYTIHISLTDSNKACNLIASGQIPQLIVLPFSNNPEVLHSYQGTANEVDECNFIFKIDVFNNLFWYQKIELFVDGMSIKNLGLDIKKTRFLLAGNGKFANGNNDDFSSTTFTANTFSSKISIYSNLLTSINTISDENTIGLIYQNENQPILKTIAVDDQNLKIFDVSCSDTLGNNLSFVEEIGGLIYRRHDGNFQVYKSDDFIQMNNTHLNQIINATCPKKMLVSPHYHLQQYIASIYDNKIIIHDYQSHQSKQFVTNNIIDVGFSSRVNNMMVILTGQVDESKSIFKCNLSKVYNINECEEGGKLNEHGQNFKISTSSISNQKQVIYNNLGKMFNLDTLFLIGDGDDTKFDSILTSLFSSDDIIGLNLNQNKIYKISSNTLQPTAIHTIQQSNILQISFKTTNEISISHLTNGKIKHYSINFISEYSQSPTITIQPTSYSAGLSFSLGEELKYQNSMDYDFIQRYWWFSKNTTIGVNILKETEINLEYSKNDDYNVTLAVGDGNSIIIDETENKQNTNITTLPPGIDSKVTYVPIKYKNKNNKTYTHTLPIRVGCDRSMKLVFDADSSRDISNSKMNIKYDVREQNDDIDIDNSGTNFYSYVNYKDGSFYPKFKIKNSITKQEYEYTNSVYIKVIGAAPYENDASQSLEILNQPYKKYIGGTFTNKEIITYNGDSSSMFRSPLLRLDVTSNINSDRCHIKPMSGQDNHDIMVIECNLKDETEDKSNIAKIGFSCSFMSPCCHLTNMLFGKSKLLDTCTMRHFIETNSIKNWLYENFSPNYKGKDENVVRKKCYPPNYVFKIEATTIDSINHCKLTTVFYIKLLSTKLNSLAGLILLISILSALLIILCGYWLLYRDNNTLMKNIISIEINFQDSIRKCITALYLFITCQSKAKVVKSDCSSDASFDGFNFITAPSMRDSASSRKNSAQENTPPMRKTYCVADTLANLDNRMNIDDNNRNNNASRNWGSVKRRMTLMKTIENFKENADRSSRTSISSHQSDANKQRRVSISHGGRKASIGIQNALNKRQSVSNSPRSSLASSRNSTPRAGSPEK